MWSFFRRLRWLFLLPIPLIWCAIEHSHGLDFIESKLVEYRFRFRGPIPYPAKFVYVDVDSRTIANIGPFPWNRKYFAEACQALLTQGHVKTIGMDFVFSDEGLPEAVDTKKMYEGDRALGSFLWHHPQVFSAAFFGSSDFLDLFDHNKEKQRFFPLLSGSLPPLSSIEPPELPRFNQGSGRAPVVPPGVGLIDTLYGGTRWVGLYAPTNIKTYYNMGLQLARTYWDVPERGIQASDKEIKLVRDDGSVATTIPLVDKQLLEINWFSGWNGYAAPPHISFYDVAACAENLLVGTPDQKADAEGKFKDWNLDGAIVLIGPTDLLLHDLAPTPMDERDVPRVSIHTATAATILSGEYLTHPPAWATYLILFVLTIIVAVLASADGARSVLAKATALIAILGYAAVAFFVFRSQHLILPMTAPLGAAFSTSFAALIWQVVEEQRQKGRIKGMFSTYLAPTLVEQMIESGSDPELGGHDAELTAYFSDIQSFSTFSEVLTSQQLGELLNEYLTACTDILLEERGSLDKYIGDAVVVMFGGVIDIPDHAYRACVATQLVQERIVALRRKWISEGDKWPTLVHELRTRIGLNTGVCMVGNMGSTSRFNYTMMGDDVNLAARMESGAKSWGVYTMVTESTKAACEKGGDRVVFRPLGRVVVKGRTKAVPIYEIVGLKESLPPSANECIGLFAQALERFYARDWDGAETLFSRCQGLEPNQPGRDAGVKTNPSLVYRQIVAEYRAEPPPNDWDGSYVMTEK